jgi:steroid delta-isomerase-like uncharacterized protein
MRKQLVLIVSLFLFAATVPCHPQSARDLDNNKKVTRAFFEDVLSTGKLDKYSESHTADFVAHGSDRDFTLMEDMAAARDERTALPDMQIAIDHMVAENDLVAVHWTAWGTNTHPGMGLPATGKPIRISGMTIFRFKAGRISEEWSAWDMLSALEQAGLFPPKQ